MVSEHSKTPEEDISDAIRVLERRDLDLIPSIDLSNYSKIESATALRREQFDFLRIKAISRNLPDNKADVERYMMEDVLSGVHGLESPFVYLIISSRLLVSVYLGILNRPVPKPSPSYFIDVLASTLQSTFPDIDIEKLSSDEVNKNIIQFFQNCHYFGIMTGIPTAKIGVEEQGIEQIERLIRGVYRQDFGYMVIADPVQNIDVVSAFDDIADIIKDKSRFIKEARQYTQTSRMTLSGETLNKSTEYYVELLDLLLDKLKLSKAQGMWRTMCYFFSPSPATTGEMSNLLKTVFSGDKSAPEALRTLVINGSNVSSILSGFKQIELELNFHPAFSAKHPLHRIIKHKFNTPLTSRDLATLTHLPKEEMPGYDVKDTARFGVCLPEEQISDNLLIGEVSDRGRGTGHYYGIQANELVKHGLITGVTGSGKTNTCLGLLDQMWRGEAKIPFLVIEPAKAEYRYLLNVKGFDDLQIFTLGDEMTSPFRLNPFEIMEGVRLQTHIDNLRAVFNASFIMYAPMPYVLERCIHEIYVEKGWDLTTNQNRTLDVSDQYAFGLFPTLTDLYNKIDPVVDMMGYEDRLTMDIKAGLRARIGSLRIGGKGSMLDTAMSIPMEILLSKPTILELQSIGDDEEKALIIGLLIARLYEFREIESKRGGINVDLKHITLIEEAHRLLSRSSADFSNLENVNTKARAVETFCNILSEIRTFGEGVLIAEQIPSKLAQDAIKNTNLKVMHRIVARDDRNLMGDTMNLSERQNRFISIMRPGEAAVFSEGFSEPFLVNVPHYLSSVNVINEQKSSIQDKDVARFMKKKLLEFDQIYGKQNGCKGCRHKCVYRDVANHILSKPEMNCLVAKYIFSFIETPANFVEKYLVVKESLLTEIRASLTEEEETNDLMFCLMITAGEQFIQSKGRQYGLSVNKIFSLLNCYYDLINLYFSIPLKTQLAIQTESGLKKFQEYFLQTFSCKVGPFPGCDEYCKAKCLFRYSVAPYLKDKAIDEKITMAIRSGKKDEAKANIRKLCLDLAQDLTLGNKPEFIENIALCFFIQKSIQWSVQEVLLNIREWFIDTKGGI